MTPPKLKTHSDCRKFVCLFCFEKSTVDLREYPKYLEVVKKCVIENYDPSDVRLPCGVCSTHRTYINTLYRKYELSSGEATYSTLDIVKLSNFLDGNVKLSRSSTLCQCLICRVAKAPGLMVKHILKELRNPEPKGESSSLPIKLCGTCLHPIHRGKRGHVCNDTNLVKNLSNLLPDKVKEQIAGKVLKEKLSEGDKENIELATSSKPFNFKVDLKGDKQLRQFKAEDILRIKNRCNLSRKQTVALCEEIRYTQGKRKAVESNVKGAIHEKNIKFSKLFETEELKDGEQVIYCNDVEHFFKVVSEERGHSKPSFVKVGVDGGGGTLKACVSLLYDSDDILNPEGHGVKKKRRKLSDGLEAGAVSNNNGVNRVLILALSTDSDENHYKLQNIMSHLALEPGKFSFCGDLKVLNIALNLMTHSARHPCPWCHWIKGYAATDFQLRTFEEIRYWYLKWSEETGSDESKLKSYYNCKGVPLSIFPDFGCVLDFIPLPELHLMLGLVNKLVDELIKVV